MAGAEDPGVHGVAVKVVYQEVRALGRKAVRSAQIKTSDRGLASFRHPIPEFVGEDTVTMELDMSEALEPLEETPDPLYELFEGLEERVRFSFESVSLTAQIPTGIAVFDLDASGNPIAQTETSAGLLEELNAAGFSVLNLPVAVGGIAGQQDAQVISFLK